MSNTLWLNVRDGETINCNQRDHSIMYRLADSLDAIAADLRVRPLTDYYDHTELATCLIDEYYEDEQPGASETGASEPGDDEDEGWIVDEAEWFASSEGLSTVNALLAHVQTNSGLFRFDQIPERSHWRSALIEELQDCRDVLTAASEKGLSFHLSIVM